jgi:two-component system sensor histidine kinase TctE
VLIDGDPDRLRELINNLIDNAVRYSQPGRAGHGAVGGANGAMRACPSATTVRRSRCRSASASSSAFTACWAATPMAAGWAWPSSARSPRCTGARITLEEDLDGIGNTFSVLFPQPGSDARPES